MVNIAELLKDCPKGMELDCTMYNNVTLASVDIDDLYPIKIATKSGYLTSLTEYGQNIKNKDAKCVIFPKGKTTWNGFKTTFKDGDIVFYNDTISIFKEWRDETLFRAYVATYLCCDSFIDVNVPLFGKSVRKEIRFATEKETKKLFKAIKDNGYRWNVETKTLEKLPEPKFNIGDKIRNFIVNLGNIYTVLKVETSGYTIKKHNEFVNCHITFDEANNWELVQNKFDINTLVPFESKVLIRHDKEDKWIPSFWGFKTDNGYITTFGWWRYCIPYEGNEHLLGKTDDCADFFKTWE